MLSDDFSLTSASEDFFDVSHMIGIQDKDKYTGAITVVSKFLNPNLKYYTPRVNHQLTYVTDKWLGDLKEPKVIPHLFPFVQSMVAKASVSVFLGEVLAQNDSLCESLGSITSEVGANLRQNWLMKTFPTFNSLYQRYIFPHKKFVSHHRMNAKKYIIPEVERRLREQNTPGYERPNDMLQNLMEMYPADGDYGVPYEDYVINWTFLLVFASIHTTTENTTMVLYWLMKYPQYIDELLEEQKEAIESEGTKGQDPELSFDVIKKLVKLDSFVREVLRQRTVGLSLQHKNINKQDIELSNGIIIPSGEHIYFNSWDVSRATDLQGEDAEDFQPWRFVQSNKQAVRIGEDHITFGMGKHACPGRFFAVQEIKTITSLLISRYKMSPVTDISLPSTLRGMPMGAIKFENRDN
ncbi:hypothetical protein K450DRAFT_238040 [Umbelopsis ramanniana AG]|uniref:Cytochrome P450 n=1 Tax=Umbelopsis ramanniana AG TaxID=1314678 RepID=A0AAD5HDL8_UMBRA|nr:uncharacterized protein K450DRAFT_238040 [Umbelopsis ramanniana AG]KAI8580337.1 hypothetical protein K450DRAFT_238040 [Umbelopsis ramanniana AG]